MVDAKFKADQDNVMAQFGEFLAARRPPLSVAGYSELIPQYNGGPHWTAQEEAQLQAQGKYASILHQGQQLWDKNSGARQLWRLFPMVYRCLPTDLFSWANQIDVDTSKNVNLQQAPFQGQRNIVWSHRFCLALTTFTMHGFWEYRRESDFPLMAQLMQLAVICRTNDCRPWHLVNHTDDMFFTFLASELQAQQAQPRTIKEVMNAVDARMNTRVTRQGPFRVIYSEVVRKMFKSEAGPVLNGTPGPYKVTAEDLTALTEVLSCLGPGPERASMMHGWSAETWKTVIEKSWPHDNRREPKPTKENAGIFARAIAFGLMARERDEKIAQRSAQMQGLAAAQAAAPAQAPSSDPIEEGNGDEDTEMADRTSASAGTMALVDQALDRPIDGDGDGGMANFAPADDEEQQPNESADNEAADRWAVEAMEQDDFSPSPSPTQGRIDTGPLHSAPKEYTSAAPTQPKADRDRDMARPHMEDPTRGFTKVITMPTGESRARRFGESSAEPSEQHGKPKGEPKGGPPAPAQPESSVAQAQRRQDPWNQALRRQDPRGRADAPGGPDSAHPDMWYARGGLNQRSRKRRRMEDDDL